MSKIYKTGYVCVLSILTIGLISLDDTYHYFPRFIAGLICLSLYVIHVAHVIRPLWENEKSQEDLDFAILNKGKKQRACDHEYTYRSDALCCKCGVRKDSEGKYHYVDLEFKAVEK